jgi:HEAT repeat protein
MLTRYVLTAVTAASLLTSSISAAGANLEHTRRLIGVLQSNAGLFDKARACQQLGEFGTRDAVPALAALLNDNHLSAYARSGLEGIPDPSAAEALRAAAGTLKGNLLAGVIHSLGVLRDANAVPLLSRLAADPGAGVARESLLALGRISTAESIQIIRRTLAEGPGSIRPEAAAACLLAAERQLAEGQAETALALYEAVRQAAVPSVFRAAATRGSILARQAGGPSFLVEQLKSEDRVIRNAALITIREIPSDALANALNAELDTAPAELQRQLLLALADCHNVQSLQVIRRKAASEDSEVRRTALLVLGKIGGAAEAGILLQALARSRSPEESALAASGLGRLEGEAVEEQIRQALTLATDTAVRIKLIRLVESRGMTNASGDLLQQAAAADAKVGVAALGALKSLAGPGAVPALIAFTKAGKDEAVREAAESAVCGVCTRTATAAAGGEAVLAELKQATDPTHRSSWVRILTCLAYAPALPVIQAALADPSEAVAGQAIEQLGHWPDPAPIEALFTVVETDANPAHRRAALRAAIQLATVAADERQRPDAVVVGWLQRADRAAQAPEERRLILSALGRVKQMESFRLLAGYLGDPALQNEAALAVVQIAPALAKHEEAAVLKEALEKIAATATDAELRNRAARIARTIPTRSRPVALFDGRSLAGWEGNTNVWRVRDNVIVGGSLEGNPRNEFLATLRSSTDFVLRLEYKLVGTQGFVNGGVQFRSVRVKQPANEMSGYQADIGAGYSGVLYDESRRNRILARAADEQIKRLERPGQWNRYEVRCAGPRIQIALNGEKTVDYTEPDRTMSLSGLIALQIHGDCKAEIAFRNLTLDGLSYSLANREFGLAKTRWKILSFSSENTQAEDERAVFAIDDHPQTFWHTLWNGGKPGHPHHLAVDLGEEVEMTGFTYLPRQDGRQEAGVIGEYEFYASRDGKEWGQRIAKGRFENSDRDPAGHVVILDQPVKARCIKLVSLSAPGGQPYAGAAEIGVLGKVVGQ